jgi:hypothetical protein
MSDQFSAAVPTPSDLIRIRWRRHELIASDDAITVDDKVFQLASIDRIGYHAASRINLATYGILLGQGDMKCYFMYDAYRRGSEMEDARRKWYGVVDRLEQASCPRLAKEAIRAIFSGKEVRFGTDIVADALGLRRRRPFAKSVPWSQITSADIALGHIRVWTDDIAGGKTAKMTTAMGGWNAVLLPRVIASIKG